MGDPIQQWQVGDNVINASRLVGRRGTNGLALPDISPTCKRQCRGALKLMGFEVSVAGYESRQHA